MKYRKGSKVEVLNTMDPTSPESWWPAEIVSGNEHTYRVMYDDFPPDSLTAVRVPRTDLRPCPPLVVGLRTWHEGDHVEVFEHNSWKPGVVVGKDGSCFSVTILGGSREIKAYGCDVRVQQTWQDSRWIMTDKVDLNSDVQVIDKQSKLIKYIRQNIEVKKRTSRKMRAIGDNGRVQRRNVKAPYPVPEKVALPEVDMDRKFNDQHIPANNICSVVDSCSINHNPYSDSHNDEVKSSRELGRNQSLPKPVSPSEEIHQLDLYAYWMTMLAFQASGPLTWEKEVVLTDLRLMLHISNDEYLLELRHLKSVNT